MSRGSKLMSGILLVALVIFAVSPCDLFAGPRYGGTLKIGPYMPQYSFLDVRYGTLEMMIPSSGQIYDGLFNWGPDGYKSLVPGLATSYETKDNKIWIFHLRKGVKFHNGREMTAEDVKANFDWRIHPPEGWRPVKFNELISFIKEVEVVDRYTIKIILEKPFSSLVRILAYAVRGFAPPEVVEKAGKEMAPPIGTGPFKVVEIKPKEKVVLERFEDYWGPKPHVDRIEYIFIRSSDARLIALEKGELDIALLGFEAMPIIEKNPDLEYKNIACSLIMHKHYFNFRRWPMNDIRFRKAMWMGADWEKIINYSRAFKQGNYARTLLEHSDFFNPEALKLVPGYNPEEAKRLIQAVEKDAGKKIPPIYWLDVNDTYGKNVGEVALLQLGQVGIKLDLHLMERGIWFQKLLRDPKMEWDTGGYGVGFGLDPTLGFKYFQTDSKTGADGKSVGGYSNPEFDRLVQQLELATDPKKQLKYIHAAEEILLKDVASLPFSALKGMIAYNKKIKNVVWNNTRIIYVTNPWTNVWIDE